MAEQAVNAALHKSFEAAEALLLERLGEVTLATLGEDVRTRVAARGACRGKTIEGGEIDEASAPAQPRNHPGRRVQRSRTSSPIVEARQRP